MEFIEFTRATNMTLGFAGFFWLMTRMWRRRGEHTYAVTLFLLTLSFYVFGVAVASAELLLQDVEHGLWSLVWLVANVALLVSLAMTHERRPLSKVEGS